MQQVINKFKAWKQDDDYNYDMIHEFVSDLSRGELLSFFEWAEIISNPTVQINALMLKEENNKTTTNNG
jgi:hypothetical protein